MLGLLNERNTKMDYNYALVTYYDDEIYSTHRLTDFPTAAKAWELCKDSGTAKTVATYVMIDPTGNNFSKTFFVKGN